MYEYAAKADRVVDGDTVDLTVDLGFGIIRRDRFRLSGIDTPELNSSDPAERIAAAAARDRLAALVMTQPLMIRTQKDAREKYGRYLCVIFVNGMDVNQQLVAEGHAVWYGGGTR